MLPSHEIFTDLPAEIDERNNCFDDSSDYELFFICCLSL